MEEPPLLIRAHAALGRLLFAYSHLQTNLALSLATSTDANERQRKLSKLEDSSFQEMLHLVLPAVQREYGNAAGCLEAWESWLLAADALRLKRNELVHGRWGVNDWKGTIHHITGLPGLESQREVIYTIKELEAEGDEAERVSQELRALLRQRPI